MVKSTADLAIEVMRLPGWLDANEEPDSEDAAHIVRTYTAYFNEWVLRDVAYWPLAEIPEEVFIHIVRIIADSVAPSFGDAAPQEIDIESGQPVSMGHKGWLGLKRVTSRDKTGVPTEVSYF